MATSYTRLQLRDFQTSSADLDALVYTFTLANNNSSTAYFAMEGVRYWDGTEFVYKTLFPSASLSTLTNCIVVSGSTNAGFIITSAGLKSSFPSVSGSLTEDSNALLKNLVGTFSGSYKTLTAVSLLASFTEVSGSVGTYNNVSSSNYDLTASITLDTTESISSITNLSGKVVDTGSLLQPGDIVLFPSESLGATTPNGKDAKFTLTTSTFTYTNVSSSNSNVTASLYLTGASSLGEITITGQGLGGFNTGNTIIFPSQSFGATNDKGEDMTFILSSDSILSNGIATFSFTPTSTIAKGQMQFSAPNAIVYSVADTTASGSLLGVDLAITP
jgi:hypothetical protein